MNIEATETRRGWIVALICLLGGLALAFGIQTPQARLGAAEGKIETLQTKVASIDQKLDDQKETLHDIKDLLKKLMARK